MPNTCPTLALVSRFGAILGDVVFTVEYAVRAARMAAYHLLGIDNNIPPILHHAGSVKVNSDALVQAFAQGRGLNSDLGLRSAVRDKADIEPTGWVLLADPAPEQASKMQRHLVENTCIN